MKVERAEGRPSGKVVLVGNPVREEVARLGEAPLPPFDETAPLKILITGGSQGASVLGEVVPEGLGALSASLRHRLQIVQQCRPEDIDLVRASYAELGIPAELSTYITDMPAKIADTHLVIARAGASTIAELTAAGRPAILVPLPSATDDRQTANAREMARAGGARMIAQSDFTADVLAARSRRWPNAAALPMPPRAPVGRPPNAARDLADLVERIAGGLSPVPSARSRMPPSPAIGSRHVRSAPMMKRVFRRRLQ